MAVRTSIPSSNSVVLRFPAEDYPKTLDQATALLSRYGDIARIDVTLGVTTGLLFVTFFDVRSAHKLLSEFPGRSESFPPAAHDFRAVSVATTSLAEMPASFVGFHTYGEIAGVSIHGEDIIVEFYDIRAAQQVTFTVPGSRPRRPLPATSGPPGLGAGFEGAAQGLLDNEALPAKVPTSAAAQVPGKLEKGEGAPAAPAAGKPAREKVESKDLSKFDIVADKIRRGEDARTTVMVRNIPKACSREKFELLMGQCGLTDRYTFFYMPFDKRRNIHCGFAFVNFKTPMDVLKLFEQMQTPTWRQLGGAASAMQPAASYARLQGQDQLMKHFSLSAVMYDNDARKRPIFFGDENEEEAEDRLRPHYVSLTAKENDAPYAAQCSMPVMPLGMLAQIGGVPAWPGVMVPS